MNKKTISLILLLISMNLFSQVNNEMFVPLRIAYYPGTSYKIPMDDDEFKDIWVRILTFHLAYPRAALNLQSKDKEAYQRLNSRLLITRSECDTFVRNYIKYYLNQREDYHQYGTGAYYIQENSGDKMYHRCVCIPAKELMDLGHGNAISVGTPIKYIEPKDFVFKFKRYGLDSLNLEEAPYYRIFPMDINPSFDCSKAKSVAEKTICRDSTLAALDRKLVQQFKVALKKKGEEVRNSQKAWLSMRDKECEGKTHEQLVLLLKSLYEERIQELSAMANE